MDPSSYEVQGGNVLGVRQLKMMEDSPHGLTASQMADLRKAATQKSSKDCFPKSSCFPFTSALSNLDDQMEDEDDDSSQGGMLKYY